jgi:hypothetical protein
MSGRVEQEKVWIVVSLDDGPVIGHSAVTNDDRDPFDHSERLQCRRVLNVDVEVIEVLTERTTLQDL